MLDYGSPLELMVRKFSSRTTLGDVERSAILTLPYTLRTYDAATYVVREGEAPRRYCDFIQKGFAIRHKLTCNGAREIVSIHLPGDFLDLQHLFLNVADHNVQALTEIKAVGIEREALQRLVLDHPAIGRAFWMDALVDASIYREWLVNIGRRDARARIAHILCEVAIRMRAAGVASDERFELPLTQEQLADAVGLTPVHVNRTLQSLAQDGIVHRNRRCISFTDWETVAQIGDFNALYLHVDQARPGLKQQPSQR